MKTVLSERQTGILFEVVELYLERGEPVASAIVARKSKTCLSPATIRHVMAELEGLGFLVQPHTSAGRIPSDLGYRLYVSQLLQRVALSEREERKLKSMVGSTSSLEEALARVTRALAQTTTEVGLAVAPSHQQATLQSLHFVRVAPDRVLGVLVTSGGLVDTRVLTVERDYDSAELERISNFCNHTFAGLTLQQARHRLITLMSEEQARCDNLLQGVLALGRQALDEAGPRGGEVFVEGAGSLLGRVTPPQLDAVRQLYVAFVDKARLLGLLNDFITAPGLRVVVGSECSLTPSDALGLIVTSFQCASGERGLVGVVGLKRMDYSRIIPIVDFFGRHVAEVGADGGRGG